MPHDTYAQDGKLTFRSNPAALIKSGVDGHSVGSVAQVPTQDRYSSMGDLAATGTKKLKSAMGAIVSVIPTLDRLARARRLSRRMEAALGYKPNLRLPRTYNEKLAWRILYDRNPLFPLTIDKVAVRDYVARKVGAEFLIPLYGVWNHAADVPWDRLPSRFVLKASHGWNMNLLVHDWTTADRCSAMVQAEGWLRRSHYADAEEWGYRDILPRLLVEDMLLDENGAIPHDLKFYVFNGKTKLLRVHADRFGEHRVTFFDSDLELLPFRQIYPADPSYVLPPQAGELAKLAERIAEDFDYARVDLYLVDGRAWFGEITHYDGSACVPFTPAIHDRVIGDIWHLPDGRGRKR